MSATINRRRQNLFGTLNGEFAHTLSERFAGSTDLLINIVLSTINNSLGFILRLNLRFINDLIRSASRLGNQLSRFTLGSLELVGG